MKPVKKNKTTNVMTSQQSNDTCQAILEKIEDGYFEVDLYGNITLVNTSFCRIIGYSLRDANRLSYKVYTHPKDLSPIFKAFNNVYNTEKPNKSFECVIIRKSGEPRDIELSISLKKDGSGNPLGFRGIMRDTTERKLAEKELSEQRSRLEAIFKSVKDAIITIDCEHRITQVNKAAKRICGLGRRSIDHHFISTIDNQCSHACFEVLKETLNNKTDICDYQINCCHKENDQQKVVITSTPLLKCNGDFLGAVLVIRDVTRLNRLELELKERSRFHNIIGKSPKMQELYQLLENLASVETTVLITGESGTGKELVTRALHNSGARAFKPLVSLNCSALAENLLESELFGHVKGAFSGAINDTKGRFQIADGGTLLLDEIGDISPKIQLKLLRVLQEKTFERVGDASPITVDVRVIACTNKELKELVAQGQFREDLYYRLKVVQITLPPLRDRLEDIPLLVNHFIKKFNKKFNKQVVRISDDVLNSFMNYSWPGNIRELEHAIEHAFVLCQGETIYANRIPKEILKGNPLKTVSVHSVPDNKPAAVLEALRKTGWNKARAARYLGIHRRTIYRIIEKHNLTIPVMGTEN